jgi:hypothetical protein
MALTFVRTKCHCGLNDFFSSFLSSELPISTSICHCSSCRHVTGQTHAIYVEMAGPPLSSASTMADQAVADLCGLIVYASSGKGTRYFCKTCGAHMYFKDDTGDTAVWEVSAGVLERFEGIVKIDKHLHVGDTLDGGVADHFVAVDGLNLPRYTVRSEGGKGKQVPLGWKAAEAPTDAQPQELLHLHCHCKAVDLYLQRPEKIIDASEQWYLVPGSTPTEAVRFLAEYCFCTSCRVTSGSIVGTWTYVPIKKSGIYLSSSPSENTALDLASSDPSKRPAALKQYVSSPTVHREFCGTCGANVFYRRAIEGRDFMDISTGLVDEIQAGGARAESWFKWSSIPEDGRAYEADSTCKALVEALKAGIKA